MIRETLRPGLPGRCAAAVLLLALPIAAALSCAPEAETRRPLPPDRPVTLIERQGVTRPAFALAPTRDAPLTLTVRDAARGRFATWLAVRGAGDRRTHAVVELDPGADCEVSLGAAADDASWHPCEIPIDRPHGAVRVGIRFEGPAGSELLVAAPVLEASAARARKPPVFVVVLDTARADGYRSFNPDSAVGEALATLGRDGITFPHARSPSGWTRTSVATLFTGQSPFTHHVLDRLDVLAPESPSLAQCLRDAGYVTHGWTTNPNVLSRWGFARGFDAFEDIGAHDWALAKPDGDRVLHRVEEEIARGGVDGRFFYLHLMDPHQPYRPKAASLSALDQETGARYALPRGAGGPARADARGVPPRRVRAIRDHYRSYLGELLETDQQVGRLLDLLRERGRYEASLLLVVADHGEEFLDHGGTGHGRTLYEEMLRVPLWLKLPGNRGAGSRIEREVDLADLLPTLLGALGLPLPEALDGADLLGDDDVAPGPHVARLKLDDADLGAVVHDGWKLVIDLATRREELYSLRGDPGEQTDLRGARPEQADALRAFFDARRFETERGWHVRACGGRADGRVAFRLRLEGEPAIEARGLEAEDHVTSRAGGHVEAVLSLPRAPHPSERMSARRRPTLADHDELLIRSPSLELHAMGEGPLPVALGDVATPEPIVDLDGEAELERARLAAGRSVRCGEREAAYLQVWRVDEPPAPPASIDPALADRLRALGYGE